MSSSTSSEGPITLAELASLTLRSDVRGLIQLCGHLLVLAATTTMVLAAQTSDAGALALWPAMALHGVVLVFLFAPLHESVHYTAFNTRWLNRVVSTVFGALLILPPRYFRVFHLAHHQHTGDPERDPERMSDGQGGRWFVLARISGLDYWRRQIGGLLRRACGAFPESYVAPAQRAMLTREARGYLAFYSAVLALSVALGSSLVVWLWLVPALLGMPWLRLYLMAEHDGCAKSGNMLQNSRSLPTTAVMRFLCWNMNFHAEHHAYAAIPFHRLPQAHRLTAPHVVHRGVGYVRTVGKLLAAELTAIQDGNRSTR